MRNIAGAVHLTRQATGAGPRRQLQPRPLRAAGDPADPGGTAEDHLGLESRSGRDRATGPERPVRLQLHRDRRAARVVERDCDEIAREARLLHLRQAVRIDAKPGARPGEEGESERSYADRADGGQRPRPHAPSRCRLRDEQRRHQSFRASFSPRPTATGCCRSNGKG